MSSWCETGTWCEPIALTSRPDENDFPSPRQMTARTSGRSRNSPRISKRRASISSSNALCFSALSLVMIATAPSSSSRTRSVIRWSTPTDDLGTRHRTGRCERAGTLHDSRRRSQVAQAEVCKTLYAGSIPAAASTLPASGGGIQRCATPVRRRTPTPAQHLQPREPEREIRADLEQSREPRERRDLRAGGSTREGVAEHAPIREQMHDGEP